MKQVNTLQTEIFRGAWLGQKYEEIAEANYCSDSHVKMIGATLWEILSESLAEKITKKNFRAVLERRVRKELKIQNLEFKTDEIGSSETAGLRGDLEEICRKAARNWSSISEADLTGWFKSGLQNKKALAA